MYKGVGSEAKKDKKEGSEDDSESGDEASEATSDNSPPLVANLLLLLQPLLVIAIQNIPLIHGHLFNLKSKTCSDLK